MNVRPILIAVFATSATFAIARAVAHETDEIVKPNSMANPNFERLCPNPTR